MKRINLLTWLILALMVVPCHSANQWLKEISEDVPLGTALINNLDDEIFKYIADPLDRMLTDYRGQAMQFNSVSQITVTAGGVSCTNAAGTISTFRYNSANTVVTWSSIDTGAESGSTQYFLYAVADTDATTNTYKISESSSQPSGATLFKKLGQFTNNSSSNIQDIINIEDNKTILGTGWGTVANGGTISLPSGFTQAECSWTVALGSGAVSGSHPDGVSYISTVNSSRVATCTFAAIGAGSDGTTTCNYIIVCKR